MERVNQKQNKQMLRITCLQAYTQLQSIPIYSIYITFFWYAAFRVMKTEAS
jgi:hypothetical protein